MDIYSTTAISRVVETMFRPVTALLMAFFPSIETSDTEQIDFDVKNGKRRIAPFVHPLVEGKLVESLGYKTNSFKPAYVKDKRVHSPTRAFKRRAGETIGGSLKPVNRAQAALIEDLADQIEMLTRRKEVMAAEVLRTGKCLISGEKYPTTLVDFGRNTDHTFTLGASLEWGDAGVDPVADVETWAQMVLDNSGVAPTDTIMDGKAWGLFAASDSFKALLDAKNVKDAAGGLFVGLEAAEGLVFQGRIRNMNFWIYSGQYVDDSDTVQNYLPDYTVIMGSKSVDGVQHHGAIMDMDVLFPMEHYTKSWTIPDPSVRILLMQSAPLVVPYRPDATLCATVKV